MPFDDFELDFELEKLNICRTIKLILDWRLDCLWCLFTLILWLIVNLFMDLPSFSWWNYLLSEEDWKVFVNNSRVVVQLTIK